MNFKKYVNEMSIAGYGDWSPSKEMIGTITSFIINKNWTFVGDFETRMGTTLEIRKLNKVYIAGSFASDELFEVDFEIKLTEHKSIAHSLNIKTLMNVDGVRVQPSKQGYGIATAMYKFLVKNEKMTILGDEMQYFGARKLWARLSKNLELNVDIVDIVDIDKIEYLEKNVKIYHGIEDFYFDSRVWGYTPEKKNIRLILTDIK